MSKYARKNPPRGRANPNAKLCEEKVQWIRDERHYHGTSYEKIAYMFGISKRQAMRICKNESWVAF